MEVAGENVKGLGETRVLLVNVAAYAVDAGSHVIPRFMLSTVISIQMDEL